MTERSSPASLRSRQPVYASDEYQAGLVQFGMTGSMSRKGNCYDKSLARYGIVEFNTNEVCIKQKKVPYDNTELLHTIQRSDISRKKVILRIFQEN